MDVGKDSSSLIFIGHILLLQKSLAVVSVVVHLQLVSSLISSSQKTFDTVEKIRTGVIISEGNASLVK